MRKLYFSKSNACNPDMVMKTRNLLTMLDVEVVEYMGGKYSDEPLIDCDILLVLPPGSVHNGYTTVGFGQYNQIQLFQKLHREILVVSELYPSNILVDELQALRKYEFKGSNPQTKYVVLDTKDNPIDLVNYQIRPKIGKDYGKSVLMDSLKTPKAPSLADMIDDIVKEPAISVSEMGKELFNSSLSGSRAGRKEFDCYFVKPMLTLIKL